MVRTTAENGAPTRSRAAKAYDDGKYGPIRLWTRGCFIRRGGMGDLFIGKNVENGQLFLVKSVAREPVWSKQLAQLQNEEKILRKLSKKHCPNIFHTVGSSTSQSVPEMGGKPTTDLFLEFAMPRGNLSEIVKRSEKLFESVAKAYTYQILQALSCMHSHGIVHHDLKGINVVICERGVKLVGFGLSKDHSHPRPMPSCHRKHDNPDQHTESNPPQEAQEDITSLGLVVSEMVTGHHPTIDESLAVDKLIRLLVEDYSLKKTLPTCMAFIESCLGRQSEKGVSVTGQTRTAKSLLCHPWVKDLEALRPSDMTSDDDSLALTPPLLTMMTDANIPTRAEASPRVTLLRKCAGTLCCRNMDADAVVSPLSSRSLPPLHKKGHKLTRMLLLPK